MSVKKRPLKRSVNFGFHAVVEIVNFKNARHKIRSMQSKEGILFRKKVKSGCDLTPLCLPYEGGLSGSNTAGCALYVEW